MNKVNENGMGKVVVDMVLKEELNQLVEVDGEVVISALGYDYINKVTEVSLLAPDSQLVEGVEVGNPYITYGNDGTIAKVIYKCISYGVGTMGNRVITSATVDYNPDVQLLKDLTYVVSSDFTAGRITKKPLLKEQELREGYFVPLKDDLIVFCNLENGDINQVLSKYAANKAYAERIAQTLARRNALKSHPALSNLITEVSGIKGKRIAKLQVTKVFDEFDKDKILEYLKSQNIDILKEEYIDIGTEIYVENQIAVSSVEVEKQSDVDTSKEILLEIIKQIDKAELMRVLKELNLFNKDSRISDLSIKQLEMIIRVAQ